jgi:hypothetical protein
MASAQNIQFGTYSGASGTVTQTGGTLTVSDTNPGLMLGAQPGGEGYYNLGGGSLNTQMVVVGNLGYGEFLQKADTTHTVGQFLNLGGPPGGEGKYTLEGGTLTTPQEQIGIEGTGTFTQTGGMHTVSGTGPGLMLGSQSTGKGYFNLEGGSLNTQTVAIGNYGYGEFVQQADTTHTVATGLNLGQFAGGEGKYTLEGGTLTTPQEQTGIEGTGTFTQTGGTHTVSGGLTLGSQSGGTGYYNLEDGSLDTEIEAIGFGGYGEFTQKTGTTHTVATRMILGQDSGGEGKYTLEGGSLAFGAAANFLGVGYTGTGTFTQSGGTLSFAGNTSLGIGTGGSGATGTFTQTSGSITWTTPTTPDTGGIRLGSAGGTGTYYLQGDATLSLGANVIVGGTDGTTGGTGFFYQSGGTFTNTRSDATGRVLVGFTDGSQGTYELSGGTLTVDRMIVGYTTGGTVYSGTGQGTLTVSGGRLEAGTMIVGGGDSGTGFGKLDLANASAQVVVSSLLQFGGLAQLSAVPGATIHMTGSVFQNTSQNPANLAGLSNLTLSFEGTGSWDPFEVAGTDQGPIMAGFTDNFALGTLNLGADNRLQLVDVFDNNSDINDSEALYVYNLELDSGAILDLNNLHLYFQHLTNNGGSFKNGSPQATPLAGTVWLLASGLLALVGLRKKLLRG